MFKMDPSSLLAAGVAVGFFLAATITACAKRDPSALSTPTADIASGVENVRRNRNFLTCALTRNRRNGAIIPPRQEIVKKNAHILLEIRDNFSPRFVGLINDMNKRLQSS